MDFHLFFLQSLGRTTLLKPHCWGGVRVNSLMQGMDEANAGLIFTNRDRLIWNIIISGSFGCSDHEIEKLEISRGGKRGSI